MSQNVALLNIDETTISDELIAGLRSQKITDVCLYSLSPIKLTDIQQAKFEALRNSLQENGFSIKAFMSPLILSKEIYPSIEISSENPINFQMKDHILETLTELDQTIKPEPLFGKMKELGINKFLKTKLQAYLPNSELTTEVKKENFYQLLAQKIANDSFTDLLKAILEVQELKTTSDKLNVSPDDVMKKLDLLKETLATLNNPSNKKEKTLQLKGLELVTYADKLLNQKKKLDDKSLNDLFQVLDCANESIKHRSNPKKTREKARDLAALSEKVSKKQSIWKKIGAVLLIIACATLVVAGVLAAIPSGGSSLLLSTIGGIGLASQIGIGVGVGLTAGLGAASLAKGLKTNPVTKFKAALEKLTDLDEIPESTLESQPASLSPKKTVRFESESKIEEVREFKKDDSPSSLQISPARQAPELEAFASLVVTSYKKAIHQSDFEDSPLNVQDIIPSRGNFLEDWNRLISLNITIDGEKIQDLIKRDGLPSTRPFDSEERLKKFICDHLLKNLPQDKKEVALEALPNFLHQGNLIHNIERVAAIELHKKKLTVDPNQTQKEIHFTSTDNGFTIQEIITSSRITRFNPENPMPDDIDSLPSLECIPGNDYLFKAEATLGIKFTSLSSDLPIKIIETSNTISYGNEEVRKALTANPEPDPAPSMSGP